MAAFARNVLQVALTKRCILCSSMLNVVRGRKRWMKPYYMELYSRRLQAGPEPEHPRSAWVNWNYGAELFAFGKRLGENFEEDTLKVAFTDRSYIEQESKKREALGVEDVAINMEDNQKLADSGRILACHHIKCFLRYSYPYLPEEGVNAIYNYLMEEDNLEHIALNLGIKDLILSEEFPIQRKCLVNSLMAVIGALQHDQNPERAKTFVQDFILTQLIGKDVRELWPMVNPMGILTDILQKQNRGLPEPRLVQEAGSDTVVACYIIGIYCDKQLIGKAPGETITIAEEMAAKDALAQMFGLPDYRPPLKFQANTKLVDQWTQNPSLKDYAISKG